MEEEKLLFQQIKKKASSKIQDIRLNAIDEVRSLPLAEANRILIKSVNHWDRRLREKSAKIYSELNGTNSVDLIINLARARMISYKLALKILSEFDINKSADYIISLTQLSHAATAASAEEIIKSFHCQSATFYRWKKRNWNIDKKIIVDLINPESNPLLEDNLGYIIKKLDKPDIAIIFSKNVSQEDFHSTGFSDRLISIIKSFDIDDCINILLSNGNLPALFKTLDQYDNSAIFDYLSNLDIEKKVRLFECGYIHDYLKNRDITKLYDDVNGREGTLYKLKKVNFLWDIKRDNLNSLENSDIAQYLYECSSAKRRQNLSNKEFNHYLEERGAIEEFAKLKAELCPNPLSEAIYELHNQTDLDMHLLGWVLGNWEDLDIGSHEMQENEKGFLLRGKFYKIYYIPKKNGKARKITEPVPGLKKIQRVIYEKILKPVELQPSCCGFREGYSVVNNAVAHINQEVLINMDLKDFFPSITSARVYGLFISLGYDETKSRALTRLTTFDNCLPQGSPTSPVIANLICRKLDSRLQNYMNKIGGSYTRYADDLSFSGPNSIIKAITAIKSIIAAEGFELAVDKFRIIRKGNRQSVTGIVVNEKLNLKRETRKNLRAALCNIRNGKQPSWNHKLVDESVIRGYIAYLTMVNTETGSKYLQEYEDAKRKPGKREV